MALKGITYLAMSFCAVLKPILLHHCLNTLFLYPFDATLNFMITGYPREHMGARVSCKLKNAKKTESNCCA